MDKLGNKIAIVLAVLVFLVYISSFSNGFVLDDPTQVLYNENVTSFNLPKLFLGSTFGTGGIYYKPLMSTAYAVTYKVFGQGAWSFHLFQILIQIANTLLVFFILKKFFKPVLAFFLAAIFGLHPFNSEAVLYVSGLQDVLFFFFGALALLIATRKKLGIFDTVLVGVLCFLSMLSKETGILFLPAIFLYRTLFNPGEKRRKELLTLGGVFTLTIAIYFWLRLGAVGFSVDPDKPYPIMRLALPDRLINLPAMFFYYIRNFFYPSDFAVSQNWVVKAVNWQEFWLPLLADVVLITAIGGLGLWFWVQARKIREGLAHGQFAVFIFFLVWFVLGMLLHLNIYPLDTTVSDRWFYFPMVGLLGIIGLLVQYLMTNSRYPMTNTKSFRTAILVVATIILLLLSVRTFARTFDWKSGLTITLRDVKYSHDSFPLESAAAFELTRVGRYDEALVHAKKSVKLGPWWWLNWDGLGAIYRHRGFAYQDSKSVELAIDSFRRATANTGHFLPPYENLAEMLFNYRSPQQAIKFIEDTSKNVGVNSHLMLILALAKYKIGDNKGALEAAYISKQLTPNNAKAQLLYDTLSAGKKLNIVISAY